MSVRYHCTHTNPPRPPYPPSYPSSSLSFSELDSLYFCEECDAVRCDQCVAVEIASYYCPNCLFDVPSANVRGDKNRCARSCFACPQCTASLQVISTEATDPSSFAPAQGTPFLLTCSSCKWSSKEIDWVFEKGTGIALQLQKMNKEVESIQAEFEAVKDHLDAYISVSSPTPTAAKTSTSKQPTRHISHLTQMAAKALGRDVPGMAKVKIRNTGDLTTAERSHESWDEIGEYKTKRTWKIKGVQDGLDDVETLRNMQSLEYASLDRRWNYSWERDAMKRSTLPERIPLQTKLTKRCPDGACRHLLIQPDSKSTRFKIKMVATNYLPEVELGRRRRRLISGDLDQPMTQEEIDRRRRERRKTRAKGDEEDEEIGLKLIPGHIYTYQMAFTNPLYDPIQIRLTQPPPPRHAPAVNHHIHIPNQHFTVSALKDAWAYDEEDEEEDLLPGLEGSEGASEGGSSGRGTLGRRSRKSLLVGSTRDKKRGEAGVEKKGNTSKVGLEVEVSPDAKGSVEFDLEVRYTYRAEAADEKEVEGEKAKKEEYKTFTYWIRVHVGDVE